MPQDFFSSLFSNQAHEESIGFIKKFSSDKNELYYVTLPEKLAGASHLLEVLPKKTPIIFDFSQLKSLDENELPVLKSLWTPDCFGWGLKEKIQLLLQRNGCFDDFRTHLYETKETFLRAFELLPEIDPFYWSLENRAGCDRITLLGPLDTSQDKTGIFHEITGKLSAPRCVLDFHLCAFIDSSGLGFLLRLKKHCDQLGRALFLTRVNPQIQQALRLARLDRIFEIENTSQ